MSTPYKVVQRPNPQNRNEKNGMHSQENIARCQHLLKESLHRADYIFCGIDLLNLG